MIASQFSKKTIYEKSIELIKNNDLLFIDDIIALIPCTKATFYKYIPADSKEREHLQLLLDENRINIKKAIRDKWYKSDFFQAQIALYRLIGTREERKSLSTNPHEKHDEDEDNDNKIEVVID